MGRKAPALALALVPDPAADFIEQYVKYADVIEAPPEAHEAVAISVLAALLNSQVYIQNGPIKVPLDLWVLLLSGSGLGRNTLVDLARPVLDEAGLNDIVANTTWGSREALYQEIATRSTGLFIWPELSEVLKKFRDPKYAGAKEWITDRYDNQSPPSSHLYRRTGKKSDTPPIEFERAPRINLLATSSYAWFISGLEQQDSTGGFIPRWTIFRLEEPTKVIPIPQPTDNSLIKPLGDYLCQARKLKSEADWSQAQEMYKKWYFEAYQRFSSQENKALAMAYFNRLRHQVLKLAVVYHVSMCLSLRVSEDAMAKAIKTVGKIEKNIFELLPTGMCREGFELDKIETRIKEAKADGIARNKLTRAFGHMPRRDREDRIQTLVDSAMVYLFERPTAGRARTILVHSSWVTGYKKQHPRDQMKKT